MALTAPGGEYVFRSGPLAEVNIGSLPTYVKADGGTLYLYSSPYGPWIYRRALVLRLFYPTYVYVNSTCGAVPPMRLGGRQGAYPIDVVIPPSYEGNCVVNFTHPSGWWRAVLLRVKLIDWYPGASERAVIVLNGSGWQFLQIGQDGTLYIWERPVAKLSVSGCVFVHNKTVLLTEELHYREVAPGVVPPVWAPSASGYVRYGSFVKLGGTSAVYIYNSPCVSSSGVGPPAPPRLEADMGLYIPSRAGYVPDWAVVNYTLLFQTRLRALNYSVAYGSIFTLYMYTYSTSVGIWGAVLRYNFRTEPLLTQDIILFKPRGASDPRLLGDVWLFYSENATFWVYSDDPPYQKCNPPCGVPVGWRSPIYVVADPTGRWGGWPRVVSTRRETLGPWKT